MPSARRSVVRELTEVVLEMPDIVGEDEAQGEVLALE